MQSYDASRQDTTTETRYKIPNLIVGTTYTVRVIATKTGVRDGMPSAEQIGVSVLGSPTGVEVSVTVDTLTVTWNAVRLATGYKVQWKSGSATYPTSDMASALRGQATIADRHPTTYDISGLTAGTIYTIQVIATHTTTAANSAPSEEVMVTSATNKPTNVRVTPGISQDLTGTVSGLGLLNVDVRGNLTVGGLTGNQRGCHHGLLCHRSRSGFW